MLRDSRANISQPPSLGLNITTHKCFIKNGSSVESIISTDSDNKKHAKITRNYLRSCLYNINIGNTAIRQWQEKSNQLLPMLRHELQCTFNAALKYVKNTPLSLAQEEQYEIIIKHLVALLPALDTYPDRWGFAIPQRINGQWLGIYYQIEKIDISPQSGLLALLLENNNRLFAYGFIPAEEQSAYAYPLLLFRETTSAPYQYQLTDILNNAMPLHSAGENIGMNRLSTWIQSHGRSQFNQQGLLIKQGRIKAICSGNTTSMALIAAAKHPNLIGTVDCIKPDDLRKATLKRLDAVWKPIGTAFKPSITFYVNKNDPIISFVQGYLEDIRFLEKNPTTNHFKAPAPLHRTSYWYEFKHDIKSALNFTLFPLKYAALSIQYMADKIEKLYDNSVSYCAAFYNHHQNLIITFMIMGSLLGVLLTPNFIPHAQLATTKMLDLIVAKTDIIFTILSATLFFPTPLMTKIITKISEKFDQISNALGSILNIAAKTSGHIFLLSMKIPHAVFKIAGYTALNLGYILVTPIALTLGSVLSGLKISIEWVWWRRKLAPTANQPAAGTGSSTGRILPRINSYPNLNAAPNPAPVVTAKLRHYSTLENMGHSQTFRNLPLTTRTDTDIDEKKEQRNPSL
jgi:hypothetical protein